MPAVEQPEIQAGYLLQESPDRTCDVPVFVTPTNIRDGPARVFCLPGQGLGVSSS